MSHLATLLLLLVPPALQSGEAPAPPEEGFRAAARSVRDELEASVAELDALLERLAAEKIPLSRRLRELEDELSALRAEHQQAVRQLDGRGLELSALRTGLEARAAENLYLGSLLGELARSFESRLHIAEVRRHAEAIGAARLAQDSDDLTDAASREPRLALLTAAVERLHDAMGGARFEGAAVDAEGIVHTGAFLLVGPAALFRSSDGRLVGTVEQRLGSLEPNVIPFRDPLDAQAASELILGTGSLWPFDPTLGNAHKIDATRETPWEHVRKGGPVMVPIFALASAALLVALYKWLRLSLLRRPSRRQLAALLEAVEGGDADAIRARAAELRGPTGRMLQAGVEHLGEPRELIEEVMYERVLTSRLELERMLPFIAVSAASAPLLGLLGTVTGIINTFQLITVFGSGDVKTLSGGISEALITTKFGLIVAIPSLLLHAFLSRKARGILGEMESAAVAFANQAARGGPRTPERELSEEGVVSAPPPAAGEDVLVPAQRNGSGDGARSRRQGASPR